MIKSARVILSLFALVIITPLSAASLDPATMMPEEWEQYRMERMAVIKAHPELDAQYQQIEKDMKAQAKKVEDAMVEIDPTVKPLLATFNKLLVTSRVADPSAFKALTPADWQKLRTVRAKVAEANPGIIADNKALLQKKEELNKKVDEVLIQTDPSLTDFIKLLQKRESGQ